MLSATLQEGLDAYGIGPKVRAIRLKRKMGLVELGRHTGLSPAMLSKIERGRLFPTLPTLLRIALVFSLGLDHFFLRTREKAAVGVRGRDRLRFPERQGARDAASIRAWRTRTGASPAGGAPPSSSRRANGYGADSEYRDSW